MNVVVLSVILFVLFYYGKRLFVFYYNRYRLEAIPSPPGHFFLGNLMFFVRCDPEELFDVLRKFSKEYWPIYRLRTFYISSINILHPEDFEIVLSTTKHLQKSRLYDFLNRWLGEGLLTSFGSKWQTRRKILTPAFHFSILQQFLTVFNEETAKMVQRFEEDCHREYLNVTPYITQMTLQSIGETAMGLKNIDKDTQLEYRESIHRMGKLLLSKLVKPWIRIPFVYPYTQIKKAEDIEVKKLHDFSKRVIKSREEEYLERKKSGDLSYSGRKKLAMLDLLLKAKHEGENIDDEGIREEVDTFMFEGHDTTAMAITYILFSLGCYQDIQQKVVEEIDEILGLDSGKVPTYNDLQELKYTERVIKETLRLYPSVHFISRIASEDFISGTGHFIPKDTILHLHIYDMHRHPSIYEDPETFNPDRFLPENCKDRHPFAYIPFSAGPRNCIGQRFAMLELKSVLCGVLRKFRLESLDKPSDLKFYPDLVLRAKTEIRIKFIPK